MLIRYYDIQYTYTIYILYILYYITDTSGITDPV